MRLHHNSAASSQGSRFVCCGDAQLHLESGNATTSCCRTVICETVCQAFSIKAYLQNRVSSILNQSLLGKKYHQAVLKWKKQICPLLEKCCPLFKHFAQLGRKRGLWRLSNEQGFWVVSWAKWDPIWAKWDPSGQSRIWEIKNWNTI